MVKKSDIPRVKGGGRGPSEWTVKAIAATRKRRNGNAIVFTMETPHLARVKANGVWQAQRHANKHGVETIWAGIKTCTRGSSVFLWPEK